MKLFIAVSCLLAVASAQYQNSGHHQQNAGPTGGYKGPLHVPVIGPNGVPQEPAAVIAARNDHLSNFGVAPTPVHGGHDQYQPQPQYQPQQQYHQPQYQQQQQHHQPQPQYHEPQPQYHQPQPQYQPQQQYHHAPAHQQAPQAVLGHDGHPLDAPDVAAAKAAHFAAYADANARINAVPHSNNPEDQDGQYNPASEQEDYNSAPAHYNSAPAHYNSAPSHYNPPPQHYNSAPQHYAHAPAGAAPGPIDTPEVAAARAAHFAAHAQVAAHNPPAAPQPHWS